MRKCGFGLSRKEVMQLVGKYVNSNELATPFKEKSCDPYIIKPTYFNLLDKTITNLCLHDKPGQVWKFDETSFCTDPKKTKIVGLKAITLTQLKRGKLENKLLHHV